MKLRAVLKWAGAAVCVLIAGTWLASRWFTVSVGRSWSTTIFQIALYRGRLEVAGGTAPDTVTAELFAQVASSGGGWNGTPVRGWDLLPEYHSVDSHGLREDDIAVPLYIPLAVLLSPTGWLFYADRRRARWGREGRCVGCGYDLSGLAKGSACPECGKAVGS